jgi:hypothetical protein
MARITHAGRHAEQRPTVPVSAREIMRSKAFQAGVADMRQGRGYRADYEVADSNAQWNYERGRAWALLAGPGVTVGAIAVAQGSAREALEAHREAVAIGRSLARLDASRLQASGCHAARAIGRTSVVGIDDGLTE